MKDQIQLTNTTSLRKTSLGHSPWRRGISRSLAAASTLAFLLLASVTSFGGSATWNLNPTGNDWTFPANWTPPTVPDGPNDTATFGVSNSTNPTIIIDNLPSRTINGIVFNAGASAFTITVAEPSAPDETLTISGVGITNNSGITQNIETGDFGHSVFVNFTNSATAGDQTVLTAGPIGDRVGAITFLDTSTAGNATLIANPLGGVFTFTGDSTGGTSRVKVLADFTNGTLNVSAHNPPGVTVGSIEGGGLVSLGANNLTVGSNNLNTTFAGVIQDGGSLTKIGTGKLVLTNANIYTGGTEVEGGALVVNNRTGSGTGSGAMQIHAGTLRGRGTIAGAVTVGTGTGVGAVLSPGNSALEPRTLAIQSTLTFHSDATYKVDLHGVPAVADKVVANGVTIDGSALFSLNLGASGSLPPGTIFTVIDNTAETPIAGIFGNLTDGSTFTIGSNTFQASYEGGTGNDLTLTVVP